MRCPFCEGEFEPVDLRATGGRVVSAKRCTQCGGFWFDHQLEESLLPEAVGQYEVAQPNYSLKAFDLTCPLDDSLLQEAEPGGTLSGSRYWQCNDCGGVFFPKGQLALLTDYQSKVAMKAPKTLYSRSQGVIAVSLVFGLIVLGLATLSRGNVNFSYLAAETQPLPTAGPNILTLILLALTYLAGTVLAVLGRRLPIIITGWSVIAVCLFGFAVLIFGP